jgi:hypothetical protein
MQTLDRKDAEPAANIWRCLIKCHSRKPWLEYPNSSSALATAGNLVFTGHIDGTLTAHDAETLQEVFLDPRQSTWSWWLSRTLCSHDARALHRRSRLFLFPGHHIDQSETGADACGSDPAEIRRRSAGDRQRAQCGAEGKTREHE